jgi:hypothetical protein
VNRSIRGDYARVLYFILHARLRVQRAPGVPHALISGRKVLARLGRIAPRECGVMFTVIARSQRVRPFGRPDDRLRDETIQLLFRVANYGLLRSVCNDGLNTLLSWLFEN